MKKSWFNSMLPKGKVKYRCLLDKLMDSFGLIENTSISEESAKNDPDKALIIIFRVKVLVIYNNVDQYLTSRTC